MKNKCFSSSRTYDRLLDLYVSEIMSDNVYAGITVIDQLQSLCEKKAQVLVDILNHTDDTPNINYLKIGARNAPEKKEGQVDV